jgi:hypothetical protein
VPVAVPVPKVVEVFSRPVPFTGLVVFSVGSVGAELEGSSIGTPVTGSFAVTAPEFGACAMSGTLISNMPREKMNLFIFAS